MRREDLPLFVKWFNDPEVRRNLLITAPMSIHQEERWFETTLARHIDEHPLTIEVQTDAGWEPAGNTGFMAVNRQEGSAEVGIFIGDQRFWNQGFGTEAMQLMVNHGFNDLNLHRIFLQVFDSNPRAIRAYEKVGFQHEGRLREAHFLEGRHVDVLVMSILKHEWEKPQENSEDE
jgi:RimJ/RimL family protein N-acetyltransferase